MYLRPDRQRYIFAVVHPERVVVTFHGLGPLKVTIQGGIPSFAAQKPPLTPESCSYGMRPKGLASRRSICAFLAFEQ